MLLDGHKKKIGFKINFLNSIEIENERQLWVVNTTI